MARDTQQQHFLLYKTSQHASSQPHLTLTTTQCRRFDESTPSRLRVDVVVFLVFLVDGDVDVDVEREATRRGFLTSESR
jgi:hypothetical protein